MNLFAEYEEKISVKASTLPKEENIFAKVNESLSYHKTYKELESDGYLPSDIYIFHNGSSSQSLLSTDRAFYGTNEVQLSLEISNYQQEEAGEYSIVVYADSNDILDDYYDCNKYDRLFSRDLKIDDAILYTETLHIYTAGKAIIYNCYWVCTCTMVCIINMANLL